MSGNAEFDTKREYVLNYFEKVFCGYLRDDIKSIKSIILTKQTLNSGSCAVPMAMAILSSMNSLGYLTNIDEKIDIKNSTDCISYYCRKWMSKSNEIYLKDNVITALVKIFRHSIFHQFLPSPVSGVTRDPSFKDIFTKVDEKIILNIDILSDDMIQSLAKLHVQLLDAENYSLIEKFFEHLDEAIKLGEMEKKEENKHQNIVDNLKPIITTTMQVTTTISGTTTTMTTMPQPHLCFGEKI